MTKRIYYEKEETHTSKIKGYIDVETDYIQLYKNFVKVSGKITSITTFKLLHWLLAERMSDNNGLQSGRLLEDFNQYLVESCGEDCAVHKATFHRCLEELIKIGAVNKIGRAHYFANPNLFWSDDVQARLDHLKDHGNSDGTIQLLNP